MSSTGSHLRGAPVGAGGGGSSSTITTTTTTTNHGGHDHCTHDHSHAHHSHSHSHSHDDVEMTTQQLLQLQKQQQQQQIHVQLPSVQDLLSDDTPPQELFKAFTTLLRFGRFEALQPLIEGLLLRPFAEDITTNTTTSTSNTSKLSSSVIFKTLLQSHDEGGHSLLHWAAKRGDDLRFLQTFLELASTLELLPPASTSSSSNNTSNSKQQISIVNTPRYVHPNDIFSLNDAIHPSTVPCTCLICLSHPPPSPTFQSRQCRYDTLALGLYGSLHPPRGLVIDQRSRRH